MEFDPLRLLTIAVSELWSATLIGSPPPWTQKINAFMRNPVPGSLVMEHSTAWSPERDAHRFGRLARVVREPFPVDDGWDVARDGPVPTEQVWYVTQPDGSEYRWTNADFLRVPEKRFR